MTQFKKMPERSIELQIEFKIIRLLFPFFVPEILEVLAVIIP